MTELFPNDGERPLAASLSELYACVLHPAMRLGALDAQAGKPLNHDDILRRIVAESPGKATAQLPLTPDKMDVHVAQLRYEEGRELVFRWGVKFRGWSWPQYPPAAVRDLIYRLALERAPALARPPEAKITR